MSGKQTLGLFIAAICGLAASLLSGAFAHDPTTSRGLRGGPPWCVAGQVGEIGTGVRRLPPIDPRLPQEALPRAGNAFGVRRLPPLEREVIHPTAHPRRSGEISIPISISMEK